MLPAGPPMQLSVGRGTLEVFVHPLRAGVAHSCTQAAALYTAQSVLDKLSPCCVTPGSRADGTLLYSMDPGTTGGDGGYTTTNDTSGLPADELEALLKQNFDYRCAPGATSTGELSKADLCRVQEALNASYQSVAATRRALSLLRTHPGALLLTCMLLHACQCGFFGSSRSSCAPCPPRSYYGNRAPYGLYIHTPWLTPGNIQAANNFLDYALGLNNTWVVTVRQVIAWMQASARLAAWAPACAVHPWMGPRPPSHCLSTMPAFQGLCSPRDGNPMALIVGCPAARPLPPPRPPVTKLALTVLRCRTRCPPARWTTG